MYDTPATVTQYCDIQISYSVFQFCLGPIDGYDIGFRIILWIVFTFINDSLGESGDCITYLLMMVQSLWWARYGRCFVVFVWLVAEGTVKV